MDDKIFERLEKLALSLKVTIEHLYEILVKQAFVSSVTEIVGLVVVLVISYYPYQRTSKVDSFEDIRILDLLILVIAAFYITSFLFCGNSIVAGLVNPEYRAIDTLISLLK